MLVIYVDDFKMSGPAGKIKAAWDTITSAGKHCQGIKMQSEPEEVNAEGIRYLGCHQKRVRGCVPSGKQGNAAATDFKLLAKGDKVPSGHVAVEAMEYDMSDFFRSCVEKYQQLAGPRAKNLRQAPTPYIDTPPHPHKEPDWSSIREKQKKKKPDVKAATNPQIR